MKSHSAGKSYEPSERARQLRNAGPLFYQEINASAHLASGKLFETGALRSACSSEQVRAPLSDEPLQTPAFDAWEAWAMLQSAAAAL
jgi:hypothetical protein